MFNYIVKQGETITDVVINATGQLQDNWEKVLNANNYTEWVPDIVAGQSIIIPDDVVFQENNLRNLKNYPICNSQPSDISEQFSNIVNSLDTRKEFEDNELFEFEDSEQFLFQQ